MQKIKLDLVDIKGNIDFEFEYMNSMNDLYSIVREQCSNVGNIIDDLLGLTLEILESSYGTPKKTIDVTDQLIEQIIDNKLNIAVSNDIAGDPDPGTPKRLKIIYQYLGEVIEKDFNEGQDISIP